MSAGCSYATSKRVKRPRFTAAREARNREEAAEHIGGGGVEVIRRTGERENRRRDREDEWMREKEREDR